MDSIATRLGGVLNNDIKEGLGDKDIMDDEKFNRRFDWGS